MRKSLRRFAVVASGMSLALTLGLAGCGQQQAQPTEAAQEEQTDKEAATEEEAEPEEVARPFMGEKHEGSWEIMLCNGLSQEITEFRLRPTGTKEWSANLLGTADSFDKFTAGYEGYLLYMDPNETVEAGKTINYDLLVTKADGVKHRYSEVPIADGDTITLKYGDQTKVTFAKILRADGSEASTRQAALDRKAALEAKKAAEEEAKRAEEEAAAAAAAAQPEETYYEDNGGYEEEYYEPKPYYEPEPEPYYEPEPAPVQSEEDCLGDGVVFKE